MSEEPSRTKGKFTYLSTKNQEEPRDSLPIYQLKRHMTGIETFPELCLSGLTYGYLKETEPSRHEEPPLMSRCYQYNSG